MKNDLKKMGLVELETIYKRLKGNILARQRDLLKTVSASLKNLDRQLTIQDSADFVDTVTQHIADLPATIKDSKQAKELQEEGRELVRVERELKARRKDLFTTLDIEQIDLGSLSGIKSCIERGMQSKKAEKARTELLKIIYSEIPEKIEDITNDTETRHLDHFLSLRCKNILLAADIETYGDIVKLRKEKGPKELMKFRNFGKKSLREVEQLLKDHDDIS